MNKTILYVIILILAAGLSFFLGAFFLGSQFSFNAGKPSAEREDSPADEIVLPEAVPEETSETEETILIEELEYNIDISSSRKKGAVFSFLFPDIDSQKGLQKKLTIKAQEVSAVRTVLDTHSADETVSNSVIKKLTNDFLFASGVIAFEKYLLFIANHIILIVAVPVFIIFSVIMMIISRDKRRNVKLIFKTLLYSLIIIFILPVSFHLSMLAENVLLSPDIISLTTSIQADFSLTAPALADLSLNYLAIFTFTYIVFPVLIITVIILLIIYIRKRLLAAD